MKGLFKLRPRGPVDLVSYLRHLLPYTDPNHVRRSKREEKALEDPVSTIRGTFAEALGAVLALVINP